MLARAESVDGPPRVAVVVPAWGSYAGAQLTESVASVTASGVQVELIVVDNASDVGPDVPPGTKVIRSDVRLSVGAARNLGLAHVTSGLVVFLDADDVILPGGLEALVDGIDARFDVCVHALSIVEDESGRPHRVPHRVARVLARWPKGFAVANSVWSLLPLQGATIMRTSAVEGAGGYGDSDAGEDWVLGASLAWRGKVTFGRRPVLIYRWREDSLGRSSKGRILLGNARAVRHRLESNAAGQWWLRIAMPALALTQYLAIWLIRPVVRRGRALGRV